MPPPKKKKKIAILPFLFKFSVFQTLVLLDANNILFLHVVDSSLIEL